MNKKLRFSIKFIIFTAIFYILCLILAFIFKNDFNSYCRLIFHELHQQEKIDIMICGASHVSHGFYPAMADEILGLNTFCTGTPGQGIDGSYAIIRETAEFCELKHVYLEMDFAVATQKKFKDRKGLKNIYLVSEGLKNPRVKFDYLLHASNPKLYLNTLLPIGNEKYIELDPHTVIKNMKAKITGEYYKYSYKSSDDYAGKGCVLTSAFVENGTFCSGLESPISVSGITDDYVNTVAKIVKFCEEKGIALTFFVMPGTDFYHVQKGNYDEYYQFIKNLAASHGYEYYDFNLARPELLTFEDKDYEDDNHFSKDGIIKFTEAFCEFFYNNHTKEECFYNSYAEKIAAQPTKIYGLMLDEPENSREVKIIPVINHGDESLVTYDVSIKTKNGESKEIFKNSTSTVFEKPQHSAGSFEIRAYYDGVEHCHISKHFITL